MQNFEIVGTAGRAVQSSIARNVRVLCQRTLLPLLAGVAITLTATAQETGVRQVDEIVTFAQKKGRAENLQEVPAAITAYNEEQLDGIFFQKLSDLSYAIPNVQLEEVGTFAGVQNFSIRGQGINSSIPSVDPTVGTFIDGVYIGTTFGVVIDTWDLESVEVLRGPQGLLFGRNVTGGAVLLRNARPDPAGELGIKARVQATNESRYNVAFAVESPIVQDVLAGKLMLYYDDDDGYFDNNKSTFGFPTLPSPPFVYFNQETSGRNVGKMETKIARPSFVWTPSDSLEISFIGETGTMEGDGAPWTVVADGLLTSPIDQASGQLPKFSTTLDEYGLTDIEWNQATLEINWDVLGGTVTSITGWREVEVIAVADVDGQGLPIFTAAGNTGQDQFSQELRFATTFADMWDMTVGLYYLTQDINYRESRFIQVDLTQVPGIVPSPAFASLALGGDMESDTYGIFWNNDITFAEVWTFTAGLRYSNEDKDTQIITGPAGGGPGPCMDVNGFVCQFDDLSGSWNSWTPKLGLSWKFNDNSQAYAFWTKGFRTGGFNFRNARPEIIPAGPTKQEEQNSYEVGLKTEVFDNKLRMNVAYFNNDIDNIQRELNLGDPFVIVLQGTINAGDVKIKGVEFEFLTVPTDYLTFYGSLGYMDGSYTRVDPAWASFLGSELPRLAPWSFSLGAGYDIPLGSYGLLNLRTDYGYRDSHPYDDANTQFFRTQRRLSGSVNWLSPDDSWTVSVFGKNIRDEANYGNLTSIAGLYTAGPMQRGREWGLELQYRL